MTALFYTQLGTGPDIVLVHGWGLHGGVWNALALLLASRYRVTVVDLPGHGRSRGLGLATDLDAYADALAATASSPAIWVGWSLGATALMWMYRRHPQKIRKLVLVGATPRFIRADDWPWGMDAEVLEAFASELRVAYRATLQRFLSLQLGTDGDARTPVKQLRGELLRYGEPDPVALETGLGILRESDLRQVLPQIAVPCQVIHGAHDRLVPALAAEFLAGRLPVSRYDMLASAGHAPFLSHPRAFQDVLEDFLRE